MHSRADVIPRSRAVQSGKCVILRRTFKGRDVLLFASHRTLPGAARFSKSRGGYRTSGGGGGGVGGGAESGALDIGRSHLKPAFDATSGARVARDDADLKPLIVPISPILLVGTVRLMEE